MKQATPEGSTSFPFTGSPSPLTNFSLVDDGTSANTKVFPNITNFQTYTVNETPVPSAWTFDSASCSATSPNGGSSSISTTTATIQMKEGENWTCTYLNHQQPGTLQLVKKVVNDNGGTKTVDDFGLTTNAGSLTFGSGAADGTNTLKYSSNVLSVGAGGYTFSENDVAGYGEGTWSCTGASASGTAFNAGSVTVPAGGTVVCTITNNDVAAQADPEQDRRQRQRRHRRRVRLDADGHRQPGDLPGQLQRRGRRRQRRCPQPRHARRGQLRPVRVGRPRRLQPQHLELHRRPDGHAGQGDGRPRR